MSLRTSLRNLIRRSPVTALHERSAELHSSLAGQTRRTVVAGTVAAAVPLPVLAATTSAAAVPSDLARACDAAVAHLAWVNNSGEPHEAWPDERLHRELDKVDDVLWRVADEPAAGLNDLAAKARLLIASDGEVLTLSDFAGDRAMVTVLHEVAALAPDRPMPPAQLSTRPVERAEYRDRLLTVYAEDRARRPISNTARGGSIEEQAAELVGARLWTTAREVLALPPPTTADGLALAALAAAVLTEADYYDNDPTITAAVGLTRAVLAFTGTPLPDGFVGFGDEPDHGERDEALYTVKGSLPAWAVAQAKAERAA